MAGSPIVKKLSMRTMIGDVRKFIPTVEVEETRNGKTYVKEVPNIGGDPVWLANIVGIARNIKRGTSQFGDWEAMLGDFMAEPLVGDKAGKRFRTGQIFLPDVILNMLAGSVNASGGVGGIEFNFKVGIVAVPTDGDKPSATGYEYVADILVAPQEADPFTKLLDSAKALALPAPETGQEEAKEPVDKEAAKT